MNTLGSSKVASQAQHYANSKAELIEGMRYTELASQAKTNIAGSSFYEEVIVGNETAMPGNTNIKQKTCVVNVYEGSETTPRASLTFKRYSVSSGSSVPAGSIIPWYGNLANIPDGFALCDGNKEKSTISGSKYFSEIVVSGESAYGDSLKKKDCTIRVFYDSENFPRSTLTLSRFHTETSSGSSGSWVESFPASGTAPSDGIIVCTSRWNTYMSITISGKMRTEVNRRDKYGQGVTNATCPIAKGEPYSISGAGRICFFKL